MTDARYRSRKFLLTGVAFLAGVAFFAVGKLDAVQWIGFTTWVLGLYLAGNVGDQAVTK